MELQDLIRAGVSQAAPACKAARACMHASLGQQIVPMACLLRLAAITKPWVEGDPRGIGKPDQTAAARSRWARLLRSHCCDALAKRTTVGARSNQSGPMRASPAYHATRMAAQHGRYYGRAVQHPCPQP